MKATVKVPGTCGELVQGVREGTNFHITCPIDLYSQVTVKRDNSVLGIKINKQQEKLLAAIKSTLDYFGYHDLGLEVDLESNLIAEKGMASSTADIVGGIVATSLVLGEEIIEELIKQIALAIEPTDGMFFPGIVDFDHLQGKSVVKLGRISTIPLLVFDVGGKVNTFDFNSRQDLAKLKAANEPKIKEAYQLVVEGIKSDDWELIGQGATLSTAANQSILYKPEIGKLIKLANNEDSILGINVAHSGTLVGVMVANEQELNRLLAKIKTVCSKLKYLMTTQIINGGYQVI